MKKIIVIGGGAAGMMAAIHASTGNEVILIEKNEKLGKKLYITGKGRCNITNAAQRSDFFEGIVHNKKFLYSSFDRFSNDDVCRALEEWGLEIKTERGDRVFPASDKSSDVIKTLQKKLEDQNVHIMLNTCVTGLITDEEGHVCKGVTANGKKIYADAVIVATGGLSYPSTGSCGDGYRFAAETGHAFTKLFPSLTGFVCSEDFVEGLSGISLKNISISIKDDEIEGAKKGSYMRLGEVMFTHKGISGPLMLTLSAYLARAKNWPKKIYIDFKPAIPNEELDKKIIRYAEEGSRQSIKNAFAKLLPVKLLECVIRAAGLDMEMKAGELSKKQRAALTGTLKGMELTLTGLCGYNEAVVTSGGVDVGMIDPKTMESKKVKGLYFAGEVLDLDALTGGFNLQIAWSTGAAAGIHAGE
jgi:predicted Rossmann fold flavoprotein